MRAHVVGFVLSAAACGASGPPAVPASQGVPELPGDGARTYAIDERGLVEHKGSESQALARPPIAWCAVDTRVRVVWFVGATGLTAFDLDDRRLYPVILGELEPYDVQIKHGDQTIGEPTNHVGLVVSVAEPSRLDVEVTCGEPNLEPCQTDVERARALVLADPAYVASLAVRGASATAWQPPGLEPAAGEGPRRCL